MERTVENPKMPRAIASTTRAVRVRSCQKSRNAFRQGAVITASLRRPRTRPSTSVGGSGVDGDRPSPVRAWRRRRSFRPRRARQRGRGPRAPVSESRLPVGSSARMSGGSFARARAIATRCCWPPERAEGSLSACSATSTRVEQLERAGPPLPRRHHAGEIHRQHHVLGGRERREELKELEDEPDRAAAPGGELALRHGFQGRAFDTHGPGRRPSMPPEHVQERRFPAAGFSDDRRELALADLEVDVAQSAGSPGRGLVSLREAPRVKSSIGRESTKPAAERRSEAARSAAVQAGWRYNSVSEEDAVAGSGRRR